MSLTELIEFNAIYRDGIIHPLEQITLPENAQVHVQVLPTEKQQRGGLAKYKGILAGKGDFSAAEISETTRYVIETRLEILSDKLNDEDEAE